MKWFSFIFILLSLSIPSFTFAQSDKIIWLKYLGEGVIWQQTKEDNIISKSWNEIERYGFMTNWQTMNNYKLCAYQELLGAGIGIFSKTEQEELKNIGSIMDGKYMPLDVDKMSDIQLQILYRITTRHCGNNRAYFLPELGKRWIFISINNSTIIWDLKLKKYADMFLPNRLIKKWKTWFFAVGLLGGNERIEFLPYDGKSYIAWMDTLLEDYSEWDAGSSVVMDNYKLLRNKKIVVTFRLLHSTWNKTYTKEFKIITP